MPDYSDNQPSTSGQAVDGAPPPAPELPLVSTDYVTTGILVSRAGERKIYTVTSRREFTNLREAVFFEGALLDFCREYGWEARGEDNNDG